MAAIDLQRGLEHGARGWGQDRVELLDGFDSEMQEWEDQLQDMQRKIEELYNEVQARRGGSDVTADGGKSGRGSEFGPSHHGNDPVAVSLPKYYGNGYTYVAKNYSCPTSHRNGYGAYHTNEVSEIGELLEDNLGQENEMKKNNNGSRHVHFNENIKVRKENGVNKQPENDRIRLEQCTGSIEEDENRRNRTPQMKGTPYRESSPNKENYGAKPPYKQRDGPSLPPRSQAPNVSHESPALDRKSFSPVVLADRKGISPSVLRKFGAMLQENEGKTLTDTGVVSPQGRGTPEPRCPTPSCQRRALGSTVSAAGRPPMRVPTQKCQAEADVLTAETDAGQEWHSQADQRGYGYPKGPGPHQAHRKVDGSPRPRPRSSSVADKGLAQGDRSRKPVPQEYRARSGSSGAHRTQRAGLPGQAELLNGVREGDDGLIELLDMLDIQHEYSSSTRAGHAVYKQDSLQVNQSESSSASPSNSFSRPARPANQRPPSRWACHTPANSIISPSGPAYRPPSPMVRTPRKSSISYSLHTETDIM